MVDDISPIDDGKAEKKNRADLIPFPFLFPSLFICTFIKVLMLAETNDSQN